MMRVTVFGAAGKTGELVVARAVEVGYTVTAFVRRRVELAIGEASPVRVMEGDVLDYAAVASAIEAGDAVVDCIGGTTPYKHTELERNAAATILRAMQAKGAGRLVAISAMGVGESKEQTPFWYEYLLMPTFLRGTVEDKTAMEAEVRGAGVPFVLVRPPLLTDDAPTGQFRVLSQQATGHTISRADLAEFLVTQVEGELYVGQAVTVVNR